MILVLPPEPEILKTTVRLGNSKEQAQFKLNELISITISDKCCTCKFKDRTKFSFTETLTNCQSELRRFNYTCPVAQNALVNVYQIRFHDYKNWKLIMTDGQEIDYSEIGKKELEKFHFLLPPITTQFVLQFQ